MFLILKTNNREIVFDAGSPLDISIPLNFNGDQPNAYGVEKAKAAAYEAENIIGDTRRGGSVNFEQYKLIPHCNGTHTECVGHITNERISIRNCLEDVFIPSVLISVEPENAGNSSDQYPYDLDETDKLIAVKHLRSGLAGYDTSELVDAALIVRTKPNEKSKLVMKYGEYVPPFFSNDAMDLIVEMGVKHLLTDIPSIDRIFDDGKLSNHRKFWNVESEKFERNENTRIDSTITEMIYVPNEIEDGEYLLNLQIAAFEADASPSRPVLFPVIK
ncbi:MAG: cyclase family protein [Pyrinomonadaceae bacterium]